MTNRNIISNELKELRSTLENYGPQNTYTVPNGYFEGLPTQILNRVRALEATEAKEELEYLSPVLSNASKEMPYSVPAGFFQNLSDAILQNIIKHADYQTFEEEIETLSPLLGSLKNKNPYSVPEGYFGNLRKGVDKKETKVISITNRRWFRLAVAAVVVGVVTLGVLLFIKSDQVDPNKNPDKWISKNVNKKVSEDKIDEFVKLAEDEALNTTDESDESKQAEIKELMKDVPEKEIQDFLDDAIVSNSNDEADELMN